MVHPAMPPCHGPCRPCLRTPGSSARHRSRPHHALARRQRGAREAAAVDRLGEDRIGAILLRLDDHVVGLADADAEFVDSTGCTSLPSACTTVIVRPGIRTSKIVIAEPLMKRSRTLSPGRNRPVQLSAGPLTVDQEGVAA